MCVADQQMWEQNMISQEGMDMGFHGVLYSMGFALQRSGVCSNELALKVENAFKEQDRS